jgi:hypothetical protein
MVARLEAVDSLLPVKLSHHSLHGTFDPLELERPFQVAPLIRQGGRVARLHGKDGSRR